jgi:hypothetical protein
MRVNYESVWKEIDDSHLHLKKVYGQRNWRWQGIVIDLSKKEWNALDSMCFNFESLLNEIDGSGWQEEKQPEQRIWTWQGIVVDLSEEQK